jgi:hypothetical protein
MRALLAVVLLLGVSIAPARAECPPEGKTREQLEALKVLKWTVADAAERQGLAEGLVDCLGDADPTLRDGIAYEALAHWMRAGEIDEAGLRALRDRLYAGLQGDDADGFRRPFDALVLSEVARTDRIKPWMMSEERGAMVEAASRFLESVSDYRGFDDKEGWRHGVAHGSDWLMQLALNPALDRGQLDKMLAAIATQVVPASSHAYVYGEPGRLARPVMFIAKRELHTPAEWEAWFVALAGRLGDSKDYNDNGWLLRRHDLLAFLTSLYLETDRSEDPQLQALEAPVVAGLKAIP